MPPLTHRRLGPADEPRLRAFWAAQPEAHIFAIPDLDHFGWQESQLHFTGWFVAERLVGYLMRYGISAQWSYQDEGSIPTIASLLAAQRIQFATGLARTTWPVLAALPGGRIKRHEPSIVARLDEADFNPVTLAGPGRVRAATLADLDALTAVHVAAPDQFNHFDYATRRRALRHALTDGWRRLSLAEAPTGQVVAAAQSSAEGQQMATIGGVVTHPAHRGQGYATAVTAHLCAALLHEGRTPYLFYRHDNRPAARAYAKIGFQPLGEALLAEIEWAQATP